MIRQTFWTDPDIKRALTPEQKTLLLYYFSSPHGNLVGLYYCPFVYAATETGVPVETVREWTLGALARFVTYDERTEEVLVHRTGRHRVGDEIKEGDKRIKAVEKVLAEAHSPLLINKFLDLYSAWPLSVNRPDVEAPSEPLVSPFEANSVTIQEQEQNNRTEAKASEGEPSEVESPEMDDAAFRGEVATRIREHFWLGGTPPGGKFEEGPITMAREITVARQMAKKYGVAELLGAMEHARTALRVKDGDKLSLLYFNVAGKQDKIHLAIDQWRLEQERMAVSEDPRVQEMLDELARRRDAAA